MLTPITADTAAAYLRSQGLIAANEEPVAVAPLSGGVSGTVLKVVTARRRLVLKQALPRLSVQEEWLCDPARIHVEHRAMGTCRPGMPDGSVPAVIFADQENCAILMECAPDDARNWKEDLLAGRVEEWVASAAGAMLADFHNTGKLRPQVLQRFEDRTFFEALRIDPFHIKLMAVHPELKPHLQAVVDRVRSRRLTLVHGDFSPKNILVCTNRLMLLDYEVAHWGDPSFDTSFCLGHLLLKAVRSEADRSALLASAAALWRSYRERVDPSVAAGEPDTVVQTLVLMLSRVDAKSRVNYLSELQRVMVRAFACDRIRRPSLTLGGLFDELGRAAGSRGS